MLTQNAVVKLVRDGVNIVAILADGQRMAWCDCKTERGAKSRLTYHARRLGLRIVGNIYAEAKK